MSTYCFGDVQGCYRELMQLLDHIGLSLNSDCLWFVGDLVNRGPDSLAVLRFIKDLPDRNKVVVLGNHDFHLLALYYGVIHPAKHTLQDILIAKDRGELIDWLQTQPLMHFDPDMNYVLAHAGIYPLWDVAKAQQYSQEVSSILQDKKEALFLFQRMYGNKPNIWNDELRTWQRWRFIVNAFTRMRFCDEVGHLDFSCQGKIGTQPAGLIPWFKVPQRKTRDVVKIVFGHWAALEGETSDETDVFALDAGCIWGRSLRAMRLEDGKIFQVACKDAFKKSK